MAGVSAVDAAEPGTPVVVLEDGINGCNGVRPTPGSENTHKRLDEKFPSDFNPGGIVGYVIDYPVDESDVSGRTTFVITDCVFVNGDAIAKYSVSFVPNTVEFKLRFSVPIPAGTLLGAQFCNYAKTTAAPSESQASNRKAGPACFTVGGGLRIEKRSGSVTGPVLPGASFGVVCAPTVSEPPTIITGLDPSQVNGDGTVSASGVADDGTIAIVGPSGTPCTVTETAPPAGYEPDLTPRNLVIPVGDSQTIEVFVNVQLGSLTITKAADADGTFTFDVDCGEDSPFNRDDVVVEVGVPYVISGIPTGTVCTVTENDHPDFTTTEIVPADGVVEIDVDGETVAFTNTRDTGGLTVSKTTSGGSGTFTFDVDCDNGLEQVITIENTGFETISGIPTGTICTVTERDNPLFSSIVIPDTGTVEIDTGGQTVAFTNTRNTGPLTVSKTAIGGTGTFMFDVDCSDDDFDQVLTIDGSGSKTIMGIPTTTSCTVTERSNPLFTTVVLPGDGTVSIDAGGANVAFTNTAKPNGITLDKKVNGGDHATSGDALLAHGSDPLTYTVVITNNGLVPLTITAMSDSLYAGFAAACPQGVGSVLAPGASFTCTYQVSAGGDAHNVAAVSAVDGLDRPVSDSDETVVDIIHPAISIVKTAGPVSVTDSGPVTYTYVVTNTGDTALHSLLVVDDILGAIGTVGSLAPGESVTFTKTVVVDVSTPPTNIGTATGTDVLGQTVSANDNATITVVLGEVLVLPELPRTGSPLGGMARAGVVLLQVGLVLHLLGRRRRRLHSQLG